jgi:hypothetical protein
MTPMMPPVVPMMSSSMIVPMMVPIMPEPLRSPTRSQLSTVAESKRIVLDNFRLSPGAEITVTFEIENATDTQIGKLGEMFDSLPQAKVGDYDRYSCIDTFGEACLISYNMSEYAGDYEINAKFTPNSNQIQIMKMIETAFKTVGIEAIIRRHFTFSNIIAEGLRFSFIINDAMVIDAAEIRRIILEDIPTMAIACVKFRSDSNLTIHNDEIIVQLLSSIVFDSANVDDFVKSINNCDTKCDGQPCGVKYRLKAHGEPRRIVQVSSDDLKPASKNPRGVYPVKFKMPVDGTTVDAPQAIFKLLPNHAVNLKCVVSRGTQRENARWSCVSALGIDATPINTSFMIKGEIRGNLSAEQIVNHVIKIVNQSVNLRVRRI